MSDPCQHRTTPFAKLLTSPCRECEYARDPALMDRAVRMFALVEDARAGRTSVSEAESEIRTMYEPA